MAEKRLMWEMGVGEDVEQIEITEKGEKIGDFSLSQQGILRAGQEYLEKPDFLEQLKPDLHGLEVARQAEIFMEAAAFLLYMREIGVDLEKLYFPRLNNPDDEFETIDEFLQDKDEATKEIFTTLIDVQSATLKNIERIEGRELTEDEGGDLVKTFYNTFLRRVEFFKQCLRSADQAGAGLHEVVVNQKALRLWQEQNAESVVPEQIPASLQIFSEGVRREIFDNTSFVELNEGCSVRCYFCAVDAAKNVKNCLTFAEASYLASHITNPEAAFYNATDPGDYVASDDDSKTYADVLTVREAAIGIPPYVSTAYPANSKDRILKMGDRISRISMGAMNRKRLHDDGLFHMFGKTGIPLTADLQDGLFFDGTGNISRYYASIFEKSRVRGLAGLVELLVNQNGTALSIRDSAFPDTFAISGRQRQVIMKKFGVEALPEFSATIVCADGVVVSPNEIVNSVAMFSTESFPNGEATHILNPDDLEKGHQQIERMVQEWIHGSQKTILDFLPYGIVQYKYDSLARNNNKNKEIVKEKKYEDLFHIVQIRTLDKDGNPIGVWGIKYHQVEGRVLDIFQVTN